MNRREFIQKSFGCAISMIIPIGAIESIPLGTHTHYMEKVTGLVSLSIETSLDISDFGPTIRLNQYNKGGQIVSEFDKELNKLKDQLDTVMASIDWDTMPPIDQMVNWIEVKGYIIYALNKIERIKNACNKT